MQGYQEYCHPPAGEIFKLPAAYIPRHLFVCLFSRHSLIQLSRGDMGQKGVVLNYVVLHLQAMFVLKRFTAASEFSYMGKIFTSVNVTQNNQVY